ncbi:MAG: gephyrin-like molybdotransferase Glp [Acidimicrobiia bacterium]
MIDLTEVQREILATIEALPAMECALSDALGLALASDVFTADAIPPFANTAMDGYAVRAADTVDATDASPVRLRVVGELPAGRAPTIAVGDGEAIRIMTGAPMPDGADAVVMVERTERAGDDAVVVHTAVTPGQFVRAAGGDLQSGARVFTAGTVLGAAQLGVLASVDAQRVQVTRRPRVGVLSTGDELVASGALSPGKIRDANRPMLLALLQRAGLTPVDLGIARDDEAEMTAKIDDALDACDAVITSGGVSVGDFDYVSTVLERLVEADRDPRAQVNWYQVAIRPAKPLCYSFVRGTPVFGLPGNPVSSLVSFELFARPALLTMAGHTEVQRERLTARAAHPMPRTPDGKIHFDRVTLAVVDGHYVASSVRAQDSNTLAATASADALALIPDGDGVLEGAELQIQPLG